jgi:ABC-type dipeptide/oligopeptide/nickel transport system ATPase subunit
MDNLDQLQAKLDKILNPSMPEPVAIPEVKAQPINPMYYQIAAGMGNNDGAATMSPIEKDLRTLTPNQLYAKYGQQQADEMLGQLALASGELQRNNLAERDWGETAWDSTTGAGNAFVGGLGSIAAWGAGKVNAETGIAITDVVESLRRYTEENQSDALNARRRVGAIKDSLTQRDSDAQYDFDIQNGNSKTEAGFDQFFRDIGNSSVFDDSTLLAQGVADAIGSFATAYPVGAAIKGVARVLVPKATARGIGLSGAMDAELGKWTVNRALSNADKLVWPVTIGTLESSGTYQQTSQDAINTLRQQGKSVGDKLELINDTAQQAADRMFIPAAALGTITRFGEKPFHVPSLRQGATNILGRELPEEAGQGAVGTILSNQAIQDNIDPNRKIGEGVADATVQGAVYGSLAAGTVQAPGLAKQSVISAAKATLGYVDKRTALAAEKADDASPVGTKALKEKASTLVPNAEPVKQNLAAELSGTDLTPEEKDQGIKYANDLVDSLKVSVENEFDDTIPPELSSIISGSEHRIDAIQQLAKKVITTSDPNEKLLTAATMYQLLQPILDLQTNRPSSVDSLSTESQAVLKDYESLIANVNNSPTIKNAMKQVHEIMVAQGATVISPVMEEELNTPAGKQKVQSIITAANIAPDQGNLDATESIMKHAKEGKLTLTPEQTTTLNTSVALLRARKELEEKNKQFGLNAADIVSSEILTDRGVKDNNARSATQYTQEILSAVRRGNTLGAAQLLNDMGLFVQHMKNKVEAINKHYLSGDTSKGSYVPYKALLPATRQWVNSETNPKAIHKGGFVNVANPDSIKFVQGVELEHKILADVYNSLTEVFPDLGIDRIEPLQLEKGISSASIVSNTGSNNTTPPPSNVPPVVTPPTPTGDGNNVPTPVSKRVKGHRAHIEVDGKHTYELTDSDVTYHYVWDTDNNELRVYSIRLTRDKETNKVIDHRLAAVDPITGSTFAHLSGGNKDILITPELVLSSVIAGGVTVQGYAQNPGNLTQEQRDKANTDLTSKAIKKRIAIEEKNIAMLAEMGITTGPRIDKTNARIKELKALLNSVPPTPASTPPVEAEIKTTPATWSNQDTDLPVDVFVDDNGTPISENGYTKVRYTAPDGKVTINYLPTTEITLDSYNDKRIKQLQDKASKSTLEELERIFKAVQVKITNKDSTTRTKEISDVYGSEITKRVAEMKEKDFMIKYTALRGSVAKGNTEDSPLLAIYDERFQKDLEEGTAAKANQEATKPVVTEGVKQAPKVGETSTEVKGRFTITKTVVSDNTVLSVHTNNDTGEVTKSEYATTYPDIYSDELGDKYTLVIYRDSANPSVITDVESFDPKDKKNSIGSYGKQGNQTDEKFITTFTEESDVTLEYTNKFEKPLAKITPMAETKAEPVTFTGKMTFAYGSNKRSDVESDTTFDAIKAGERTATTRYESDGKIDYWSKAKVGDIIEFSNKDGDIVRVEVTKPLTKLPLNTNGETWSKKEGWSIDYFNKNVKPKLGKAYQLEYKLIGKAEPKKTKTPESTPPVSPEAVIPSKAFELNDGQKNAFTKIMEFINDSRQTFSLVGPAGTGKTTIVNTIIAALRKAGSIYGEVTLTSPTHRANTVTRSKNPNETVVTLHKLLGLSPSIDLDNLTAEDVKFAQRRIPEDKDPFPKDGLVIVDESSMMNEELYNFLMIKLEQYPEVKILFLGDLKQLRPIVKDTKDKDGNTIKAVSTDSPALLDTKNQVVLDEVMRAKNPELLDESTHVRKNGRFTKNNQMKESNGVGFSTNINEFTNVLVSMFKSKDFLNNRLLVRAVAYTNNRVKEINKIVRTAVFGSNAADYIPGDLIMGYKTYLDKEDKENILLANGVDYLVLDVGEIRTEVQKGTNKYGMNLPDVSLLVQDLTIKDIYGVDGVATVTVVLPSNTEETWAALGQIYNELSKLPRKNPHMREEVASFYNSAINRFVLPQDVTIPSVDWNGKPYLDQKGKPKTKSVAKRSIDYGYAHTIHKSQGGTYTYVFVDDTTIGFPADADTQTRLRYVGMTRAEKGAFILVNGKTTGEEPTLADFVESDERITQEELDSQFEETVEIPDIDTVTSWARYPTAGVPNIEVSTKGDAFGKQFSALNATLNDGRTIEEAYQVGIKGHASIAAGKGKPPLNSLTKEETWQAYKNLWRDFFDENPELYKELKEKARGKVLTDQFASTFVSQARAISEILNEHYILNIPKNPKKTETPTVEPTNKVDPKTFTNHSGGAYGADTMWDTVGREFGVTKHNHYRDEGNSNLSKKLKDAGVKAVTLTAAALNKARDTVNSLLGTNHKDDLAGNLQARNYYQVANSDGVFAIGSLTPNKKGVTGGTNTAIQLAIKLTDKVRPVYVWDTNTQRWYEFNRTKGVFQATTTPTLTKEFAGIGTRDIENYNTKNQLTGKFEPRKQYVGDEIANAAKQAIKDVYAKTLLGTTPVNEELDNELPVEDNIIDDSPIVTGNKNAVIKVKPDTVVPSKFSNLVQGVKNFFINSFKFKGEETTRTNNVESPLEFVKDALLDNSLFQEAVPNSKYSLNKDVIKAYKEYLGRHYNALNNTLAKNLQDFLTVPNKKGVVRLNRINKGDPLHRYGEGKVLNLTEKVGDTYKYNQHLLELATLAGLQWFLTAGQTERRLEAREIAKLTGIPEGKLSNSLIDSILNTSDTGQLSQGLTNTIKSFWGVSGINTEMMAYTDGIAEAMAAEIH